MNRKWFVNSSKLGGNQAMMNPVLGVPIEVHTEKKRHRIEKLILSDRWITVTEPEAVNGLAKAPKSSIYSQSLFLKDLSGGCQKCSLNMI